MAVYCSKPWYAAWLFTVLGCSGSPDAAENKHWPSLNYLITSLHQCLPAASDKMRKASQHEALVHIGHQHSINYQWINHESLSESGALAKLSDHLTEHLTLKALKKQLL